MQTAEKYLIRNGFITNKYKQFIYKAGSDEVNLKHMLDEYAKLYASEKVKEALKLAAERAKTISGCTLNNCEMPYCDACMDDVDKQSILSLETELLNKINKEI